VPVLLQADGVMLLFIFWARTRVLQMARKAVLYHSIE
jgi:hypothetical protein